MAEGGQKQMPTPQREREPVTGRENLICDRVFTRIADGKTHTRPRGNRVAFVLSKESLFRKMSLWQMEMSFDKLFLISPPKKKKKKEKRGLFRVASLMYDSLFSLSIFQVYDSP